MLLLELVCSDHDCGTTAQSTVQNDGSSSKVVFCFSSFGSAGADFEQSQWRWPGERCRTAEERRVRTIVGTVGPSHYFLCRRDKNSPDAETPALSDRFVQGTGPAGLGPSARLRR